MPCKIASFSSKLIGKMQKTFILQKFSLCKTCKKSRLKNKQIFLQDKKPLKCPQNTQNLNYKNFSNLNLPSFISKAYCAENNLNYLLIKVGE